MRSKYFCFLNCYGYFFFLWHSKNIIFCNFESSICTQPRDKSHGAKWKHLPSFTAVETYSEYWTKKRAIWMEFVWETNQYINIFFFNFSIPCYFRHVTVAKYNSLHFLLSCRAIPLIFLESIPGWSCRSPDSVPIAFRSPFVMWASQHNL